MSIVTYSYARQNLAKLMDEAERDRAPVYISRQGKRRGAAVLLSLEDYEALETTRYLQRSPKNAELLRKAVAELDAGKGVVHSLVPVKPRGRHK
jgi:antitoxin YefM